MFIALVVIIYFTVVRLPQSTQSSISSVPKISLEEDVCKEVARKFGDCKILLFDATSHLVFAETHSGIIPVLTNKQFTEFEKFIYPMMDFQEFKEEKNERGSIDWRVDKDSSMIYGFAEDNAKTIVINSEGNVQPNKFFVRDNLWVWYVTFQKDEVTLPIEVSVYDADGKMIFGDY